MTKKIQKLVLKLDQIGQQRPGFLYSELKIEIYTHDRSPAYKAEIHYAGCHKITAESTGRKELLRKMEAKVMLDYSQPQAA